MIERVFQAFALALPTAEWSGPDQSDQHGAPPRISWELLTGTLGPAKRLSGGPGDEGVLWTRNLNVRVRIWGKDLAQAEELYEGFVNVLELQLSRPSYDITREDWSTGGLASVGKVVELQVVLRIPIPRKAKQTRVLEGVTVNYQFEEV